MSARRSWWRANRWWLLALPVSLALMLAAQSYRVEDFWWRTDSHRLVGSGEQGDLVEVRIPGSDAIGDFTRDFSVRLVGVADVAFEPDELATIQELPDGSRAVEVELEFQADPEQLLAGCRLVLVDDDGVRYGGSGFDPLEQGDLCVPANRPGPQNAFLQDQEERVTDGQPRPPKWTITWLSFVPEDAVLAEVRLSYEPPDYVELRIPPS